MLANHLRLGHRDPPPSLLVVPSPPGGRTAGVHELGFGAEPGLHAGLVGRPAKVDVLRVHEALLAKPAGLIPKAPVAEHNRTGRRLFLSRPVMTPVRAH